MKKSQTIFNWKHRGLILTSKEELDEIYDRYINSTNCEKCGNEYRSTIDRHMDHAHSIDDKYGYFRNILCRSCNFKRCKIHSQNTSGYQGICKKIDKRCKQGFRWVFRASINGKLKTIKQSVDKEWLIDFAEKWKIENDYDN